MNLNLFAEQNYTNMPKKVSLIGPCGVGKTNMIRKILGLEFEKKYYPTTFVSTCEITIEGKKLEVYDFAGQEPIDSLKHPYLEKSDVIVICYGPSDIQKWEKERKEFWKAKGIETQLENEKKEHWKRKGIDPKDVKEYLEVYLETLKITEEEYWKSKNITKEKKIEEAELNQCDSCKFVPFKPYEIYCKRYGLEYVTCQFQCDTDCNFEEMKFSSKSMWSVTSFWQTVKDL